METVVFTGCARLLPLDRGKRSGELQLSRGAVGRIDRGVDLAREDRVAHADDRIFRILEGVFRVPPQAARGDVDGVGAEADEDWEERADLGAADIVLFQLRGT